MIAAVDERERWLRFNIQEACSVYMDAIFWDKG